MKLRLPAIFHFLAAWFYLAIAIYSAADGDYLFTAIGSFGFLLHLRIHDAFHQAELLGQMNKIGRAELAELERSLN